MEWSRTSERSNESGWGEDDGSLPSPALLLLFVASMLLLLPLASSCSLLCCCCVGVGGGAGGGVDGRGRKGLGVDGVGFGTSASAWIKELLASSTMGSRMGAGVEWMVSCCCTSLRKIESMLSSSSWAVTFPTVKESVKKIKKAQWGIFDSFLLEGWKMNAFAINGGEKSYFLSQ